MLPERLSFAALCLGLVCLAGCGSGIASSASHSGAPTPTPTTPAPPALTVPVNVVIIGDSVTAESCCTSDEAHSVPSVLRNLLAGYGTYGSGIVPLFLDFAATLRPEWTLDSGSFQNVTDLGPWQGGDFASTAVLAGSSTMSFNSSVAGNQLIVYGEQTTDNTGCSVSIDGGSPTLVGSQTSATATPFAATINTTTGVHGVTITPASGGKCYLYAAQWMTGSASGIALSDIGRGFARSAAYGTNPATQLAYLKSLSPVPQIAVIALGVNDVTESPTTAEQYQTQMQAIINQLVALNPKMSIILIDEESFSLPPLTSLTQAQVRQIEQSLAELNGLTYASIADAWGTYAQAVAAGLCVPGGHPTDAGAASIASLIYGTLAPKLPS